MHDDRVISDSVIGYRLVRLLGAGDRAEVFLAAPPQGEPVVLKMARAATEQSSMLIEAEALDRARGPHVPDLIDVATSALGPLVLVLQRIPGPSLAHVLRKRGSLTPGEAITVLVPLHEVLTRLHRAGVCHGGVAADAVLFDRLGAPVLARFGRATLHEAARSEAALDDDDAVSADRLAYRALAELVLAGSATAPDLDLVDWEDLPRRLFAIAPAAPLALGESADRQPAHDGTPDIRRALGAVSAPPDARAVRASTALSTDATASPRPGIVDWVVSRVPKTLRSRLMERFDLVRRTSRRQTLTLGAAGVGVLIAIIVVATMPSDSAPGASEAADVAATGATPSPSALADEPGGDTMPAVPVPDPVLADDPIAALVVLLERREECLLLRSILCLDGVGQPGSAALSDDHDLVRALQNGAEAPQPVTVTADRLVLEERLGDSALVTVDSPADSEPASLLLMKGEAGWRIRSYLTE